MKQACAILFLAACVFATVSAFPAAFEDEADYLRTARQIIQGRVSRSPQMGYYGSYPGYNYNSGYGYPNHAGRRMAHGYEHFNMVGNNGYYQQQYQPYPHMQMGHYHG